MNRLHYRNFVYSIIGLTAIIIFAALILLQRMWPFMATAFHPTVRNFADACGCAAYVSGTSLGWPTILGGAGLLLIIALIIIAFTKAIHMMVRTHQFEKTLRVTIVGSTISKGITIYRSNSNQPLAVCIGVFRPRIYVTQQLEALLSPVELWAVIRHELDHAIHRDPLYRLILSSLQVFFPFFGKIFQHYQALPELAADEAIDDDTALQRALVKILEADQGSQRLAATFFSTAEVRINRLLGTPLQRPSTVWFIAFIIVIGSGLSLSYQAVAQEGSQQTALSACMAEQPICQEIMTRAADPQATILPPEELLEATLQDSTIQSQPNMNILTTEQYIQYEVQN